MELLLRLKSWQRKAVRGSEWFFKQIGGVTRALSANLQPLRIRATVGRIFRRTKRLATHVTRTYGSTALGSLRKQLASLERHLIVVRYRIQGRSKRHDTTIVSGIVILAVACSYLFAPLVQDLVGASFNPDRFTALRSLLGTIGGALVGATAIGFSVVTIAVQLNFARMPHGLFVRLSSDPRLLGAFAGTFLLAVGVSTLSLVPDAGWVGITLVSAIWGTLLILLLFLYGYRRALDLINPAVQLGLLVSDAETDLLRWARRADRMAPLLAAPAQDDDDRPPQDLPRAIFYRSNPFWTNRAKRDVAHAASFARRHADQGDFEVSASALNSIVAINAIYVKAKGKTFFASNPLFDIPDSADSFINDTLEHLRRLAHAAAARSDEEPMRQIFAAIALLAQVYLDIDYGRQDTKEHARLAAGYLTDVIEKSLSQSPPDLLMEGVRLVGRSASLFLALGYPNDATSLIEKIATFSMTGAVKPEYRSVTLTGMDQLAQLTLDLIKVQKRDIGFATSQLRNAVEMVAKIFLNTPDTPLSNIHSSYLSPYFSLTKTQTLADKLTSLTNALIAADRDDPIASSILRNFDEWSEEIYKTAKTLLLLSIERRSHFAFDIIHWIQHITTLLVGLSKAPATDDHTREELEKNAIWLMSTLSWIPDDQEAINFVANFSVTELIFAVAIDAIDRDNLPALECSRDLLIGWALKAGAYETGWGILEKALLALATVALWKEELGLIGPLKLDIAERLAKASIKQDILDRTARNLRREAAFPRRREYEFDRIHHAKNQLDSAKISVLVTEIADLISPATVSEKVPRRF